MIEPAELVLAYSSRITGASSVAGSRPSTRLAISWFMLMLAWCSQKRCTLGRRDAEVGEVAEDHLGHHRHDFLEHLAAFLAEQLVGPAPVRLLGSG